MNNDNENFINPQAEVNQEQTKPKSLAQKCWRFFTVGCAAVQTGLAAVLVHKIATNPELFNTDLLSWNTAGKVAGVTAMGFFLYDKYKENEEAAEKFAKKLMIGLSSINAGFGLHMAYKVSQNTELLNPDLLTFPHIMQTVSMAVVAKYAYDFLKKDDNLEVAEVVQSKRKLKM